MTKQGTRCKALVMPGTLRCAIHSDDPVTQEKMLKGKRLGGQRRTRQLTEPTLGPLDANGLDLSTMDGLVAYVARALGQLARLPFDVRVANAIGQLVNVQRGALEASDFENRLATLEKTVGMQHAA